MGSSDLGKIMEKEANTMDIRGITAANSIGCCCRMLIFRADYMAGRLHSLCSVPV